MLIQDIHTSPNHVNLIGQSVQLNIKRPHLPIVKLKKYLASNIVVTYTPEKTNYCQLSTKEIYSSSPFIIILQRRKLKNGNSPTSFNSPPKGWNERCGNPSNFRLEWKMFRIRFLSTFPFSREVVEVKGLRMTFKSVFGKSYSDPSGQHMKLC